PHPDGRTAGLLIARGRFSDVKIEALMREHGAEVEDYNGKRLIVQRTAAPGGSGPADRGDVRRVGGDSIALSFLEPGLVAVGSGFLGLAKLQAGTRPGFQAMMQSLELGGAGNTVALSFSIPGEIFDAFGVHPEVPQAPAAH